MSVETTNKDETHFYEGNLHPLEGLKVDIWSRNNKGILIIVRISISIMILWKDRIENLV
jgi:hypothetical protein